MRIDCKLASESRCLPVNAITQLVSWVKWGWAWIKWPVALGILGWLFWVNQTHFHELSHRQVAWGFLAAAVVLSIAACLTTFTRWFLLVWGVNVPFHLRDAVRLGFIGMVLNYVMPGAIGGDLCKAVILAHGQPSRRTVAVATIFLDRVLGMISLLLLGAFMSLLPLDIPKIPETQVVTLLLRLGTVVGLLCVGGMLIPGVTQWGLSRWLTRLPVVGRIFGELLSGVAHYQSRPWVLAGALGLGTIGHMFLIASFYCGGRALEPWTLDLMTHFYFMPIAELFGSLLPTPNGIGGLEKAVEYSYVNLAPGVDRQVAGGVGLISTLAYRVVQLVVSAIGFIYYMASRAEVQAAIAETQATAAGSTPQVEQTAPVIGLHPAKS